MEAIKTLVVDDDAAFLRAAVHTLSTLGKVRVVGAESSGPEAMSVALLQQPDLILLHADMPVMDGARTAARMRAQGVTGKIVFISPQATQLVQARELGVSPDGFIRRADFAARIGHVVEALFPANGRSTALAATT